MQEDRGETQKSFSTRKKISSLQYTLSGTGHGSTESMRKCRLRDFEAGWENVCEDIMLTNNAYFIYIHIYIPTDQIIGDILKKILKVEVCYAPISRIFISLALSCSHTSVFGKNWEGQREQCIWWSGF